MSIVKSIQGISVGLRSLSLSTSFNAASKQEVILKKPVSAYILFYQDQLKGQKMTGWDKMDIPKAAKKAGAQWKTLAVKQKEAYLVLAEKNMAKYKATLDALPNEQLKKMAQLVAEKKERSEKLQLKKNLSELLADKPKGPLSAYNLFIKENHKGNENFKELAKEFKKISPTKLQQLNVRCSELKAQRLVELSAWSQKIEEDGRDKKIAALRKSIRELKN